MKHLVAVLLSLISWILAPVIFAIPFIIHDSSIINIFNPNYYGGAFLHCIAVFWPLYILAANLSNIYINNRVGKIIVLFFIYVLQIFNIYISFCMISSLVVALFLTLTLLYYINFIIIGKIIAGKFISKYEVRPSIAKMVIVVIYLVATVLFTHVIKNPWLY